MGKGGGMEKLLEIAKGHNGYVTSGQATEAGIPRRELAEATEAGELVKLDRGLYALPDTWEDPLVVAQHRFARGVFSDDTALWLWGLSDRAPFLLTMTFPRGYNKTAAKASGISCRSCADDVLRLGLATAGTPYGNEVRAYDAERSLCDVVRGQRVVDAQLVVPAFRKYVRGGGCDPTKLVSYAKKLGVERKIRGYLEVLL